MMNKILLFLLNIFLKRILDNPDVEQRKKDLTWFLNTILDSLRDNRLDEAEIERIKEALGRLMK